MTATIVAAQGMGGISPGEAFLKAVRDDDVAKALELVSEPGSGVANYRGYGGDAALHIVTRKRELDWIGYLLQKGADPNLGDAKGDSALIIASRMGYEEAVAAMLRYAARVDGTNKRGETALNVAVQARQPRIVELLLRAGANPDKADHVAGLTPRDYAKRDTRNPQLMRLIDTVKSTKKKAAGPSLN